MAEDQPRAGMGGPSGAEGDAAEPIVQGQSKRPLVLKHIAGDGMIELVADWAGARLTVKPDTTEGKYLIEYRNIRVHCDDMNEVAWQLQRSLGVTPRFQSPAVIRRLEDRSLEELRRRHRELVAHLPLTKQVLMYVDSSQVPRGKEEIVGFVGAFGTGAAVDELVGRGVLEYFDKKYNINRDYVICKTCTEYAGRVVHVYRWEREEHLAKMHAFSERKMHDQAFKIDAYFKEC